MNPIQQECITRGITRLCHFTQSRNLAHIFDDPYGLCSTRTLQAHDMPHNPTDPNRYDGRDDLVCCSIDYPNTYYFYNVRNKEPLFKDWVVLLIEHSYLWHPETCFCPRNAAADFGRHIDQGLDAFRRLFVPSVTGSGGRVFQRGHNHLISSPTDIQAEVLLKDPVPLESIIGIVVKSEKQAQREVCRLNLQGISIDKPIYIAPDFFKRTTLSGLIQRGVRATEILYRNGGRHGR